MNTGNLISGVETDGLWRSTDYCFFTLGLMDYESGRRKNLGGFLTGEDFSLRIW